MNNTDVECAPELLDRIAAGHAPTAEEALSLADYSDLLRLMDVAELLRNRGHGKLISYSRKVFIPLTNLCRDSCHYCTFAKPPSRTTSAYLTPDEVLSIARAGARAGCHEALFTLGDKPELRYRAAQEGLSRLGHTTTLSYLAAMAKLVREETGLLPHLNPGIMTAQEIAALRAVSVSQGIMLESTSERLTQRGGPHFGSPDKVPAVRLETIRQAGEAKVPFTSGILIGIGETRRERVEALLALLELHDRYGHIQEVIVQNFKPKPNTRMAHVPEADADDHLWTVAMARIVLGPTMNIQAPPNLTRGPLHRLIKAGINDWGGISPVTPDHVNPEAPWPEIEALTKHTEDAGGVLVERLAVYPEFLSNPDRWIDPSLQSAVLDASDADGLARTDSWVPGSGVGLPVSPAKSPAARRRDDLQDILDRAGIGEDLSEIEIAALFGTRGDDFHRVCEAADAVRQNVCGNNVTYTVNRNINYTNICYFRCKFCAFSKGKLSANLRGRPYDLALEEIQRHCDEAWERGATEVCLQGGIHPDYTGATYLSICRAIKEVRPNIHIHAFSPLEIFQGAATLGRSVKDFLQELKDAGLGSLPGTAAEILDDEVRAVICPDKVTTRQWLEVIESAHSVGLRTTATIMFGHVDSRAHWARHLMRIRDLQARTGGFTEFVPLPFVPTETPIYLQGRSRRGPTFREAVLMHAVARLALHPLITNVQTSWVKMGPDGVKVCLNAGANDLGGTLMNESITRAAGATHGEELAPAEMEALIRSIGRVPQQRTTLYRETDEQRRTASFNAAPIQPVVVTAPRARRRGGLAAAGAST